MHVMFSCYKQQLDLKDDYSWNDDVTKNWKNIKKIKLIVNCVDYWKFHDFLISMIESIFIFEMHT